MLCGGLGADIQREQKVRAVIASITVLGFPGRYQHTGAILYVESLERLKDRKSWKGYTYGYLLKQGMYITT